MVEAISRGVIKQKHSRRGRGKLCYAFGDVLLLAGLLARLPVLPVGLLDRSSSGSNHLSGSGAVRVG